MKLVIRMGIIDDLIRVLFGRKKTKKEVKGVVEEKIVQPIKQSNVPKKPKRKKPRVRKAKIPMVPRPMKGEMEEAMKEFRNSIKILAEKIDKLNSSVEQKKIEPKQALGGAQVIYNELKSEKKDVSNEIKQTKSLMQFLEKDFLQRKINEEMFRKKMFDYREKLHLLSMEKKELLTQKKDLTKTTKSIPQVAPVSLEKLSKTDNLEKLLVRQTQTLEKLAEQSERRARVEEKVIKAAAPVETERIETAMRFTQPMKKIDRDIGVETKIKKYKIETDFDKILVFVEKEGRVKIGQIAKETGISKKRVDECCKLLRSEKQVYIVYPTFGDPLVQTMDYKERAEIEKIKNKKLKELEKKKGKRD